jgi:hypothetical protein
MLDIGVILIVNTIIMLLLAVIWKKSDGVNLTAKIILWFIFIVDLLYTLNHYGVLLFGKIPLV